MPTLPISKPVRPDGDFSVLGISAIMMTVVLCVCCENLTERTRRGLVDGLLCRHVPRAQEEKPSTGRLFACAEESINSVNSYISLTLYSIYMNSNESDKLS